MGCAKESRVSSKRNARNQLIWLLSSFPKALNLGRHAGCTFGDLFDSLGAHVTAFKLVQDRPQCGPTQADLPHNHWQVDWVIQDPGAS
jgi:hypothetical protein